MIKRIVLCADDYGQAPAISEGILALIQLGRLSAVSCLVNGEDWTKYAIKILPHQQQIDIGLHLNLTEGRPVSSRYRQRYGDIFLPLPKLMKRVFWGNIDRQACYEELAAQIQLFRQATGFLPQFLDGHQHVHQFPIIRKIIIRLYKEYFNNKAPVRLARPPLDFNNPMNNIKKIFIGATGLFFAGALRKAEIAYNPSFSGVYDFQKIHSAMDYRRLFCFFLAEIKNKGLIMCHPGWASNGETNDVIARSRYFEYQYLSSEAFIEDCLAEKISLEHFLVLS